MFVGVGIHAMSMPPGWIFYDRSKDGSLNLNFADEQRPSQLNSISSSPESITTLLHNMQRNEI